MLILSVLLAALAIAPPVRFQEPGCFLNAQQRNAKVSFRLPVESGRVYDRATISFRMHVGRLPPALTSVVTLTRPGNKGYFGLQIRGDKRETIIDRMNGHQSSRVAPWKENSDYQVSVNYDRRQIAVRALRGIGEPVEQFSAEPAFPVVRDNGEGLILTFGLDTVDDNAYNPSLSWRFSDLKVELWPSKTVYTKSTYTYKRVGGCEIQLDVYRPPDRGLRPAILWLHGGALIMGHRGELVDLSEHHLKRYIDAGFAVVVPDYRLAPETKLPEILSDLRDAYAWLRREGRSQLSIDPRRIAVVGHSAGGYLALAAGYQCIPRPRAVVAFYGYGDIGGDWYGKPSAHYLASNRVTREEAFSTVGGPVLSATPGAHQRFRFYVYLRQNGLWAKEVAGTDSVRTFSPRFNLTPDYPPTMLLHGDRDGDVPISQSEVMAKELRRNGVRVEFVPMLGLAHGFDMIRLTDPAVLSAFDRVITFLEDTTR